MRETKGSCHSLLHSTNPSAHLHERRQIWKPAELFPGDLINTKGISTRVKNRALSQSVSFCSGIDQIKASSYQTKLMLKGTHIIIELQSPKQPHSGLNPACSLCKWQTWDLGKKESVSKAQTTCHVAHHVGDTATKVRPTHICNILKIPELTCMCNRKVRGHHKPFDTNLFLLWLPL